MKYLIPILALAGCGWQPPWHQMSPEEAHWSLDYLQRQQVINQQATQVRRPPAIQSTDCTRDSLGGVHCTTW